MFSKSQLALVIGAVLAAPAVAEVQKRMSTLLLKVASLVTKQIPIQQQCVWK